MASDARAREPQEGARRRDQPRSPHVPAGLRVRRVPPPRCPCRCCDAAAACLPTDRTLERLQRRLGRARDERPSRHQRLQALTERLLPRAPAPAPATAPTPAAAPAPPPPPAPHSAPVLPPVPPPRARHRHSPPRGLSADFDADNITLVRVEPRSIVGSYAQKTIPYRSASFSQGDFAPDKYYRGANRQPSIFDFGRRPALVEAAPARADSEDAGGSVASVDSAVGSDEGLLAHASPAPRSPPPEPHKPLSARSLTHPLPRRAVPAGAGAGARAAAGSLPALMAPRVLHELREESDGSQADSAQPRSEAASPLEARPFTFPPLPDPPAPVCVNPDCECADITESNVDPASVLESSIPVPVYECIVKQWSKELPQDEQSRSGAASDGSLDRDKEDETITSEQVAHLLAAVQNPRSPAPVGVRERRRPLDKTKRRKGIYITTASDDGAEEDPPSSNGRKRESGDASPRDTRLSDEARTSSLLGDKSDDSCTNGPPSPSEMPNLMWPRSEELRTRRSRLSHQSSDEREDDSYRTRRKFGVASRGDSPSESDSWSRDRTASPSPFGPEEAEARRQQLARSFGRTLAAPAPARAPDGRRSLSGGAAGGAASGAAGGGHVRATSSPSKLAGARAGELLAELLRGSSEALSNAAAFDNVVLTLHQHNDTRTHVVVELYETEKSYVDALDILVTKYLEPLKSPENAGLLESFLVDEIFYQIPAILALHQNFLEQLRRRLEQWDLQQKVGDVFLDVLTKPPVMDTYMSFISNLRRARAGSKAAAASRPAFARFLDALARGHKGKLSLDNLLIKPVQRFPSYKLLIQRLIKHTESSHPDHALLVAAQKEIHSLLELINCTERESEAQEQQLQALRDLEQGVEGLTNIAAPDQRLLRHSCVRAPASGAAAAAAGAAAQPPLKERALFLLSDTLLIASVKRRANAVKKPIPTYQSNIASQMEGNKYKLLMRVPLADVEIVKAKDENLRRIMHEVETLTQDVGTLTRISEQVATLRAPHAALEDMVRDSLRDAARALAERRACDTQLCCMELSLSAASGPENLTIIFPKPEDRSSWEELINETKQKLCAVGLERAAPVFLAPVPIRKTRAGLQFTCAAPTTPPPGHAPDVWVCNSDGYVGQVCVLSLAPRPQVASCSGVCNARILALAAVPARPKRTPSTGSLNSSSSAKPGISVSDPNDGCKNIRLDSSSSSEEEDEGSSASSMEAERRAEAERRTCDPARGACGAARGGCDGARGGCDGARGGCDGVRGTGGPATPAHAKSLSAPAPPPPPHPVTKSSSNPTVDKYAMGINTGTLSTPASRQSSEDAGSGAAMWLGTEDGCVHVFSQDNIRAHKHKLRMQHGSPVHCIVYEEGKVFVALGNGDVVVYARDIEGSWAEQCALAVGGGAAVGGMLATGGRLWCAAHSSIKIINPHTLQTEETFQISSESSPISHMAASGGGVWLALQHAAQLRCYRAATRDQLAAINLTPVVTKMLHGCDDIIRQHKAACLRVTALAARAGVLWVGTSAGVLLAAPLQRAPDASGAFTPPPLQGIPYGHTGHVRFLTIVENPLPAGAAPPPKAAAGRREPPKAAPAAETLVISGGDGYEDFRSSSAAEDAGREDSTNHLLLWRV